MRRVRAPRTAVVMLALLSLLGSLAMGALVGVGRAKRGDAGWSIRRAVRTRGGNLAVPLERLHDGLGSRRVHRLERAVFGSPRHTGA